MNARLDNSVIRACQKGNKAAYAVLVKRYYKSVFALCLGMLGNVHDAEDTTQEAMLKGLLKIKKLHKPDHFEWWILQIARNLCIDSFRRQKRVRVSNVEESRPSSPKSDDNDNLQQAIRRLPQELRVPLTMFYFDGKNAKRIAETLNISHSRACHRIRTARQQLHELLTERTNNEQRL
ncbi:MAG: sigma-70 family RNA polymerase sigma factor [Phycisphaerales bacterium]|nr:MAG: sigma-70 family RNA polymerase sigma factor [Phycisphaerales bacterium]